MTSVEKRKTYQFLAYAAGASNAKSVHNANEAKKLIDSGITFDWVLCEGDKTKISQTITSSIKPESGKKKRKRGSDGHAVATPPKVEAKVADSELLVQSLILGTVAEL